MKCKIFILVLLLSVISIKLCKGNINNRKPTTPSKDTIYTDVKSLSLRFPDQAIELLQQRYSYYENKQDTLNMVNCLLSIVDIHLEEFYFNKAFDQMWEILPLAEKLANKKINLRITNSLGILYNVFDKTEMGEFYFKKSLETTKKLAAEGKIRKQKLVSAYFNLILHYSKYQDLKNEKLYMDSCYQFAKTFNMLPLDKAYLDTEQGKIFTIEKKYKEAEEILMSAKNEFESIKTDSLKTEVGAGFLVFVYENIGDLYRVQNNIPPAIDYYNKANKTSIKYNAHISRRIEVLLKLSQLHEKINQFDKAYKNLQASKLINDSLFGPQSHNNKQFLDIKNKYIEKINAQNIEIERKNAQLLRKERRYVYTIVTLVVSLFCAIIAGLIIRNRIQKRRYARKQQQSKKLLEVRNKELTSYTLQFIEKEKTISELVTVLKSELENPKKYTTLLNQAEKKNTSHWEEFNACFVEVNQNFYQYLRTNYPDLTSSDLKLCALMKLNFSTKEMSHLLGISPTSVNMARYRLRKKMGLSKDENLNEVIAGIS